MSMQKWRILDRQRRRENDERTFGELGKVATFDVVVGLEEDLSQSGRTGGVVLSCQ
jgi:hypothetical protein